MLHHTTPQGGQRNRPMQTHVADTWTSVQRWKLRSDDWSSVHGIKILSKVDDLAFALDDTQVGMLVALQDEAHVREALQLIQAEDLNVAWMQFMLTICGHWNQCCALAFPVGTVMDLQVLET